MGTYVHTIQGGSTKFTHSFIRFSINEWVNFVDPPCYILQISHTTDAFFDIWYCDFNKQKIKINSNKIWLSFSEIASKNSLSTENISI